MAGFVYVLKNAGFLLAASVVTRLLTFAFFLLIARMLGINGLGEYSFVFAFVTLFSMLSDVGMSQLFVREAARKPKDMAQIFHKIIPIKIFLVILVFAVTIITVNLIPSNDAVTLAVYMAAFSFIFLSSTELILAVFQAKEKMWVIGLLQIVQALIIVVIGAFALLYGYGLLGVVAGYLTSYFIIFVISIILTFKQIPFGWQIDSQFIKSFLKQSMPFWFTTLFIGLAFRIDTVMIEFLRGSVETGLYNASFRLLDALYFIPGSIVFALFPTLSKLHAKDNKAVMHLYRKGFYYLLAIALPMAIGATLLAERFISVLYGSEFAPSAQALKILIWAEVAIFLYSVTGFLLNAVNKQLMFTIATLFAAIINVVLNFYFISNYGFVGAAITTVITQAFILILLLYKAHSYGYGDIYSTQLLKPFAAGAAMTLAIFATLSLHIVLIVPIAAAVYFVVLYLVKGVEQEERAIIKYYLKF